jgi:hypothetical protein
MMIQTRFVTAMLMPIMAVALTSCGTKSVEGTYNVTNAPVPGIVATFGKSSFSFSSGASGNYEVSGDKVILTGSPVAGAYTIKGDTLVGDKFTFVPRDPNDKSPVNLGPRGMSND